MPEDLRTAILRLREAASPLEPDAEARRELGKQALDHALAYLDVVRQVKDAFGVPTFVYQVSGEYAMIEASAAAGAGDRNALILETLMAFKRAGATGVLTYHAADAARLIGR